MYYYERSTLYRKEEASIRRRIVANFKDDFGFEPDEKIVDEILSKNPEYISVPFADAGEQVKKEDEDIEDLLKVLGLMRKMEDLLGTDTANHVYDKAHWTIAFNGVDDYREIVNIPWGEKEMHYFESVIKDLIEHREVFKFKWVKPE